ncbi:MAG: hypothetical protein KGJ13_10080 [Patescibacteria group bacterium]|nr:hypothetical protein [Patescibacteria group bacterium]
MAIETAFQATGKTVVANVSGTINTVNVVSDAPANQLRFYSVSADVAIRVGNAAGNAIVSLPTPGVPGYGMPIVGGSGKVHVFTVGPTANITVSMISLTGNAGVSLVYITPGEGALG